jgi:cytochrome c553
MTTAASLRALLLVFFLGLASAVDAQKPAAPAADPNESCLMCHTDPSAKEASGKSIAVDTKLFAKSVHGEMNFKCTDCHSDVSADKLPHPDKLKPATCASCHEDAVKKFTVTAHGKALKEGKTAAASCTDCHGAHDIKRLKEADSRTNFVNIEATCGSCHGAYSIKRASAPEWQNAVVGACGTCHDDFISSFRHTYHGKVTTMGFGKVATCASCHGAHDVRPASDPLSKVAPENRLQTCRTCHTRAGAQFVSWDRNPRPKSKEPNLIL